VEFGRTYNASQRSEPVSTAELHGGLGYIYTNETSTKYTQNTHDCTSSLHGQTNMLHYYNHAAAIHARVICTIAIQVLQHNSQYNTE